MNKRKSFIGYLSALSIVLGSATAFAQTAADTSTTTSSEAASASVQVMSPFVVNQGDDKGYSANQTLLGTRSAKDLLDIPGTVTIVDKEMLEDLNAINFAQVIEFGAAGVTQFQNFQDDMMIRGFRSQSMRNGIVNSGSNIPSPLYDVDRVEIIKGPAAMLLGTNSFLGGAINYIPIAPTDTPSGNVSLTLHTDEKGKSFERIAANVMGPLYKSGDVVIDYRITAGGLTGDTDKQIESLKEEFIGGALSMHFNKDTSININFYVYSNDSYIYYDDFLDYNAYYNEHRLVLSPYSAAYSSGLKSHALANETDGDFDLTFLSKLTENSNFRIFFSYFDTGYNEKIPRYVTFASPTTINRQYIPYVDNGTNAVLQADYLNHLDFKNAANDFYAGIDYTVSYYRDADVVDNLTPVNFTEPPNYAGDAALIAASPPFISTDGTDSRSRDNLLSYYFQDNLSLLNDRIDLIGGIRWFYDRTLTEDANYQFDGGQYATPVDYAPLQVYKVGAVVKPVSWLSLYWTKATNETPQSGFTNPASGPPIPYGNNVGSLTEFGVKLKYNINDKFQIYGSADHFNMALTNVYTTDSSGALSPNGNIVTGVADNTSVGAEAEFGFRAACGPGQFDVFATAYRADTLAAALGGPEHQASGSPGKVYSLIGKYTFNDGFFKGFMIGGGAYGQNARYELGLPIDTPTIYNLFARYVISRNWSLQANADDVTNKIYIIRIATPALVEASQPGALSLVARFQW